MGKKFTLRLDGTDYEIERQGRALVVNGKRFEPRVEGNTVQVGEEEHTVEIDGQTAYVDRIARPFEVEGLDARAVAAGPAPARHADVDGALTAIMPGSIIKVLVEEGASVSAGDVIVILEAMKMENEICAPKDGVVKEIRTQAGDNVQQNQVLAVIA